MARSLNKVQLIGNLGVDPELRYTPNGQPVCDVRLATNEQWKDRDGQKQERTEWHRVVIWGKPAEVMKQYASKGSKLYLEGRLQTRSWEDRDGNKRYTTEIVCNEFMFLGGRNSSMEGSASFGGGDSFDQAPPPGADFAGGMGASQPSPDDDIPF